MHEILFLGFEPKDVMKNGLNFCD